MSLTNNNYTRQSPNVVVIFCHGSGDTGFGLKQWVETLLPSSTQKVLDDAGVLFDFPSATPRPYKLMGGQIVSIWFDRIGGLEPTYPEDIESIELSTQQLNNLIDEYIYQKGIPSNKIVLGGFSMGGGIALQTAARCRHKLGAVFALSSYLNNDSWVWDELTRRRRKNMINEEKAGNIASDSCDDSDIRTNDNNTNDKSKIGGLLSGVPVFMAHGELDNFILTEWGEQTAKRLKEFNVNIQSFVRIPQTYHELTSDELKQLIDFLMNDKIGLFD